MAKLVHRLERSPKVRQMLAEAEHIGPSQHRQLIGSIQILLATLEPIKVALEKDLARWSCGP